MKLTFHCAGLMLSVFFLTGCGEESTAEMIARMKPEYDDLRAKLVQVADLVDGAGAESTIETPDLDPVPHFVEKDAVASNTAFLMYEHLTDPDGEVDPVRTIDLRYSGKLKTYLRWTGEQSPLRPAARKREASEENLAAIETILQHRYLAVAKMEQFTPIQVLGPETYRGGNAVMTGYLVDLQAMEIVRSFPVIGTPPPSVEFSYVREEQDPRKQMAAWARSGVYTSLRESFDNQFEEATGGEFIAR